MPSRGPRGHNSRFIDMTGNKYGRLLVIKHVGSTLNGKTLLWEMQCDCGKVIVQQGGQVRNGKIVSCGCFQREASASRLTKHGKSRTREYTIWNQMIARCYNQKNSRYYTHGGRGITVCDRWRNSVEAFIEDMGLIPGPKYSIDRINNDGNYEPENCRWATVEEQMNNKRTNRKMTYKGKTQTIAQWSREVGIRYATLLQRTRNGWTAEKALTTPPDLYHSGIRSD
jgi:hypothetical protein